MILRVFSQFGLIFLSLYGFSQASRSPYPQHYFNNPLKIPITLAANFGELRPNHFHMGLDIRTEKRENLPVYASADGYVARIKVEPFGFGQAIYINHPNGFTTVYAHLNEFFPALAKWVRKQQYKQESWKVTLEVPSTLFPVKKGDLIAYSGNTGGSQGPHLHFEIRRTADDLNLNPMLFGLPIADNTKPIIQRLAIYDGTKSVYAQSPRILQLVKKNTGYTTGKDTIMVSFPRLGLAIGAFDTQSRSENPNGIFKASLTDNDIPRLSFQMDAISYLFTRNVNGHIDYKTKALGGPWLQQLFVLPGLGHSIYSPLNSNGIIDLADRRVHTVRIEVEDAYGNRSVLKQDFQYNGQESTGVNSASRLFHPGTMEAMETNDCSFYICENCLYDSANINFSVSDSHNQESVSRLYTVGTDFIPLQDLLTIRIKSSKNLTDEEKSKVVMIRNTGKEMEVQKVEWQNDWATGKFRDFGLFQLVIDNSPPEIKLLGTHNNKSKRPSSMQIAFTVSDNLKSVKNVRATLDGKWILFTNDKERAFIFRKNDLGAPGMHELKVVAEDEAGNRTIAVFEVGR